MNYKRKIEVLSKILKLEVTKNKSRYIINMELTTQPVSNLSLYIANPLENTYVPNTDENISICITQYNYLRNKGIKLKSNPKTDEEKILRKVYRKLQYAKSQNKIK